MEPAGFVILLAREDFQISPGQKYAQVLLRFDNVPYTSEGNWIEGMTMDPVLTILQVAILLTVVFAYGRK